VNVEIVLLIEGDLIGVENVKTTADSSEIAGKNVTFSLGLIEMSAYSCHQKGYTDLS